MSQSIFRNFRRNSVITENLQPYECKFTVHTYVQAVYVYTTWVYDIVHAHTHTYMYISRHHTYHTNFCGMYTIWQIVPASGLVMLIFTKECISAVGSFGGDRKVCASWKFLNANSFYKICEIQPNKFIASAVCTPHGPRPCGMRCTSSNMYC